MAKLSVIYDCLNKMIIDIQINVIKYAEVKSAAENLKSLRKIYSFCALIILSKCK